MRWGPCDEAPDDPTLQCATLAVPVDWSRPTGEKIDLAVARRTASNPAARIGSLLVNPGGPGGSGRDFAIREAQRFSADVREHFDVVGFDPRGVGLSHPVLCSFDLRTQEPPYVMTSQSDFDARLAYNQRLRDDCRAHTGPVIDHLDTLSVIKDMDTLRAALGDRQLTYYGTSYGSLLGQQYAERFPDQVRAIVVDSNMDHSLDTRGFLDTSAESAQDSFDQFVAWCARTDSCALHGRDIRAVWNNLLARAERGEIPSQRNPGEPALPDELIELVFSTLYIPDYAHIADVITTLDSGESLPGPPGENPPPQRDLVNFSAYSIFCNDWNVSIRSYDEYAAHLARMREIAPDMRYSMAGTQLTVACLGAPQPVANPQHRLKVRTGGTPLLLVNSRHDPATGYNWATNAARQLDKQGVLLTYDGGGHGVYGRSDCVTGSVDRYLISLTLPAKGTHCPAVEPVAGTRQQTNANTRTATSSVRQYPY
jgi:pimeloyl-ACP methyl ester carboxylesterase